MTTTTTTAGTVQTGTGNATYITGISSGLNTQALITAGYQAKLSSYNKVEDKITKNTNIISSYSDLQSRAKTLQTALDKLQSTTQNSSNTNAFYTKQVSYTASDSSSGSNIVTATTTDGATAGIHKVVVSKIAQALSVTSDSQTSSTAALNLTGTFTIGEDGKTAQTITVTATSTLADVRDAINATTTSSGVKADLLQVAGGGYKLVLTSSDTAKSFTVASTSGTDVLKSLGVTQTDGTYKNVSQAAQQADFTLDGTEILSDTNSLDGVLTGLNLQLNNAAPGTTVSITLSNNTSGVTSALNDLVSAYNALRTSLVAYQQVNSDGSVPTSSYLANDSFTRSFAQALDSTLTGTYTGSTYFPGLGALGITLDSNNQLTIATDQLSSALTSHFSEAQSLFQTANGKAGLGDTLYSYIDSYTNSTTGQFTTLSTTLTNTNTTLQTQADNYKTIADNYQTYLINKYALLETQISTSQTTISQVKAILTGSSSSNN